MLERSLALLSLLLLAAALRAQEPEEAQVEPPTVEQYARTATELATRHQELTAKGDQAQLAACQKEVDAFVAGIEKQKGLSLDHYVQASSPLLNGCAAACIQVAEAGIAHYADSRFLWDHVGFARTQLATDTAPSAARVAALKLGEQAFRKAVSYQPDTFHAHLGLSQILSLLDRADEALDELELATKDDDGKAALPNGWLHRAGLLVRVGRSKDAIALLTGGAVPEDGQAAAQVLLLRAHAIDGDAAATQALIGKLQKDAPGTRTLIDAADALAFLGKKAEALKLLAQRQKPAAGASEEREEMRLDQGAATLEAFWKATDYTPKGPLRAALTATLGHRFLVMDPAAKPKPKETEVGSSPLLMARLLAVAPEAPTKSWGDRMLQVLCVRAVRDYKASPFEKQVAEMTKAMRTPTEADVPGVLLAMRWDVGNPDACGVLTGLRAIEKLEAKVAPAKK